MNTPTSPFVTTPHIDRVREFVRASKHAGQSIGFVPTMGALHDGHVSLMRQARQNCDVVIASIFVNPTQFAPNEDLKSYPRPLAEDLMTCANAGVTCVFHPDVPTMYPDDSVTVVDVRKLTTVLEGAHRPTHFQGVTTVVMKLLNIVMPDSVFFGQKDYQQQLVIRRMCIDLDVPVEIVTCPTIRETDGLAMSSRNRHLTAEQRTTALSLSMALRMVAQSIGNGESDMSKLRLEMQSAIRSTRGIDLEYATIVHPETLEEITELQSAQVALIAARVGSTRLIDNMEIYSPSTHGFNRQENQAC